MRIGLIGKYVSLPDAYLSVVEALRHGGFYHGAKVEIEWIQAEDVEGLLAEGRLKDLDGIVIPGGFGERGIEGKIAAAGYAREHAIPCLGLCLGLQVMTIEFARNVLGLAGANSREFDSVRPTRSSTSWTTSSAVVDMGGTMRLGAYVAQLDPGSQVAEAYGDTVVSERHRHRYEFNPGYRNRFEDAGLCCSGVVARRPAGRVHRAARPPVLGRHPGPPRVQEPARPAPPAVPRVRRRRPGAGRGPHPRDCSTWHDLVRDSAGSAEQRAASVAPLISGSRPGTFEAPDGSTFERDIVHHPARCRWCPSSTQPGEVDHGPPVPGRRRPGPVGDPRRQARCRRRAARASPPAGS